MSIAKAVDAEMIIDETDNTDIRSLIRAGVRKYNVPYLGAWEATPFVIYFKNSIGAVIGGTYGRYIPCELVDIDYFWIDEKHRHQKLGTKLMKALEDFAKKHKVPRINLYTMEFQAMPFYEKLGFTLLATVPNWARQYDAHFMRKILQTE